MKYKVNIEAVRDELNRRAWLEDPAKWITEKLGERLWSKQVSIAHSVRDNRRTAVPSCHSSGKSFLAARIAAWWIECHPPGEAFVVTTAPTGKQVKVVLWREITRAHANGKLSGRTNQTEWWRMMPNGNEEMVSFGIKPSDVDPASFQGIKAKYMLVIFDEACGIPEVLWNAADTLISNNWSKFLAIGNPDDPSSEFAAVCSPGSGWNTISISAFDTPNFSDESIPSAISEELIGKIWVEEKKKKWGVDNPMYIAKILGVFPESVEGGLIPIEWIKAAQIRELAPGTPIEIGMDVGAGGDKSVIALRRGPVVRVIRRDREPDTMKSCGNLLHDMKVNNVSLAKVDKIGIGIGIVNRTQELGKNVVGVNVASASHDPENFVNIRASGFWGLRERFETGDMDIDPEDDDLAAQLVALKFFRNSAGKVQIAPKASLRIAKGVNIPSPDEADAVMLAYVPIIEKKQYDATW